MGWFLVTFLIQQEQGHKTNQSSTNLEIRGLKPQKATSSYARSTLKPSWQRNGIAVKTTSFKYPTSSVSLATTKQNALGLDLYFKLVSAEMRFPKTKRKFGKMR